MGEKQGGSKIRPMALQQRRCLYPQRDRFKLSSEFVLVRGTLNGCRRKARFPCAYEGPCQQVEGRNHSQEQDCDR